MVTYVSWLLKNCHLQSEPAKADYHARILCAQYVSEAVTAISEANVKTKDIAAAVEVSNKGLKITFEVPQQSDGACSSRQVSPDYGDL